MEQPTLTDAEITAALQTHYVPTKYGRKIGIKRISSTAFQECQFLFAPPVREEAGWVDPMKIGFQDVPCTACGALRGAPCEALCGDQLPHEVRITQAGESRQLRGIRAVVRAAIVDPKPTPAFFAYIERDVAALKDLGEQVLHHQGVTEKARDEITDTFRQGDVGPEAGDVPVSGSGSEAPPVSDCA